MSERGPRVFVLGDLNVDYFIEAHGDDISGSRRLGGTAINAALAFQHEGFNSIIVGALGDDEQGAYLAAGMRNRGLAARTVRSPQPTGTCVLMIDHGNSRRLTNCDQSANAVDPLLLGRMLMDMQPKAEEPVFVATHMLARRPQSECMKFFAITGSLSRRIIIDLLPHDLGARISGDVVEACLKGLPFLVVSELRTIRELFVADPDPIPAPMLNDWRAVFGRIAAQLVAIRYGGFGVEMECVAEKQIDDAPSLIGEYATMFENCIDSEKAGFGDRLTARLVRRLL